MYFYFVILLIDLYFSQTIIWSYRNIGTYLFRKPDIKNEFYIEN